VLFPLGEPNGGGEQPVDRIPVPPKSHLSAKAKLFHHDPHARYKDRGKNLRSNVQQTDSTPVLAQRQVALLRQKHQELISLLNKNIFLNKNFGNQRKTYLDHTLK
jgi:hypothetical protein